MGRLEEGLKKFGIKSEWWREAAHKVGTWFRWAEGGAEAYMQKGMTRRRAMW